MIRGSGRDSTYWPTPGRQPIFRRLLPHPPVPGTFRHLASEAVLRTAVAPLVHGLWRTRVDPEQIASVQGPCFLYGNHSNNLDAFIFNMFKPWGEASSGVLTAEYMRGGVVSTALRGIGLLATRKRIAEPHLIKQILRLLDQGRMVFIYPEGGRRWDGRPRPWIEATAKLFARIGVPVHPILTHGSYVAWPRWARFPRPAHLRVEVRPPVALDRSLTTAEAVSRLAAPIAADENEPPDDVRPRTAFRPADGIERLLYRDPRTGRHGGLFTPDGHRVVNADGSIRWRVLPDSRLLDERSGEVHLGGDLYATIRSLPLEPMPDGSFLANTVGYFSGPPYAHARAHGTARLVLHADRLEIRGRHETTVVASEDVLAVEVERNFKLEVALADRVLRFDFVHGGSALQWQDVISGHSALGSWAPNCA